MRDTDTSSITRQVKQVQASRISFPAQLKPAAFLQFVRARWIGFLAALSVIVGTLYPALVTHASTSLTIDTNVLFSAVNGWITTFLPIAAIGLGIAIALAVIAFVGDAILQGFKGRH